MMSSSLKKHRKRPKPDKKALSEISESIQASNRFTSSIKESIKEEPDDVSESIIEEISEESQLKRPGKNKFDSSIRESIHTGSIQEDLPDSYSEDFDSVSQSRGKKVSFEGKKKGILKSPREPSVVDLEKKYLGTNSLAKTEHMYKPKRTTPADDIVSDLFTSLNEYEKASTSLNFVDRMQKIVE